MQNRLAREERQVDGEDEPSRVWLCRSSLKYPGRGSNVPVCFSIVEHELDVLCTVGDQRVLNEDANDKEPTSGRLTVSS